MLCAEMYAQDGFVNVQGRFQTHTVASEGAELDDNYQKMVADSE